MILPALDFQFAVAESNLVPKPFAKVFQPANVYPVLARDVAESSVIVEIDDLTVTESATVPDV